MKQYFIANWKMNSPPLPAWVQHVSANHLDADRVVVLAPPYTQLAAAQMVLNGTEIELAAQDCHHAEDGAYTGDISARMCRRSGCGYVIVGHSERRQYHGETDEQIGKKIMRAQSEQLVPILCVGENLLQREAGQAEQVVQAQLQTALAAVRPAPAENEHPALIVAYEPVWAIGTGKVASAEAIESMHASIKKILAQGVPVLYGGSVKPDSAAEILALPSVDGVLVGGASLDAETFVTIMRAF